MVYIGNSVHASVAARISPYVRKTPVKFCLRCRCYGIKSLFFFLLVKVLKDDIAKHKALFQASENTGQKLIERSQEDPAVVAEVYSKLYKVRTALDKLSARADQRFSRLQHVLLQSQELQVSFDEFLEKLDRLEGIIALQAPVSGVCDTVKEQNQQQQVSFGISAVCTDIMIQKVSLRAQIVLS